MFFNDLLSIELHFTIWRACWFLLQVQISQTTKWRKLGIEKNIQNTLLSFHYWSIYIRYIPLFNITRIRDKFTEGGSFMLNSYCVSKNNFEHWTLMLSHREERPNASSTSNFHNISRSIIFWLDLHTKTKKPFSALIIMTSLFRRIKLVRTYTCINYRFTTPPSL